MDPLTIERPETVADLARLALEHGDEGQPSDRPVRFADEEPYDYADLSPARPAMPAGRRWGWLVVLAWLVLPALVAALIWTGDHRYGWLLIPAAVAAFVVHGAYSAARMRA